MKTIISIALLFLLVFQNLVNAQNKCLYLDGNDDCVRVSDVEEFRLTDFTFEVWVNTIGTMIKGGNIIRHDDFSNTIAKERGRDLILFRIGTKGEVGFKLGEGGSSLGKGRSTITLTSAKWYHLALVRNAMKKVLTLYVNGAFNSSINLSNSHTIDPRDDLYIGAYHESTNGWKEFFKGKIDKLRIWNRALAENEIKANISRVISGNENGLVLYYNFNELTSDGRVRDLSACANHGILQGGAHLVTAEAPSFLYTNSSPPAPPPLSKPWTGGIQSLLLMTSAELSKGKGSPYAGGSSCCGCKIDHYGYLPSDLPKGKVGRVSFFLRGSMENSYYTKKKYGPTQLKFIIGKRESFATSERYPEGEELLSKAPWIINFKFSPPAPVEPEMEWKLLDGDNNKYSAVTLHAGDVDLSHGIRGFYKTYNCQYARTEEQSYSVQFDYVESETPIKPIVYDKALKPVVAVRDTVYKTAVVEFTERGDLGIQDAGAIIAEWITTALNKTGAFEVYERLSLEKLMEEHKLGMSGLIDDATIAEIGRMHGVQAIVTGSVIKFGNIISVTAKVIDVETAKIIDSADIKANSVDAIPMQLERLAWELAMD